MEVRFYEKKSLFLYGGKSAEHEVSIRTAFAVIKALDFTKYSAIPVYITKRGEWIKGDILDAPVKQLEDLQFPVDQAKKTAPIFLTEHLEEESNLPVVFPLLHGPNGEYGTVHGLLEVIILPYVGNGVLASSAGMDKVIMKNLFEQAGLNQVIYVPVLRHDWEKNADKFYDHVEKAIGYPCFVKPANLGSSVGINKCRNREELEYAFHEAFQFDRKLSLNKESRQGKLKLRC